MPGVCNQVPVVLKDVFKNSAWGPSFSKLGIPQNPDKNEEN